jgi:hypothetical protein
MATKKIKRFQEGGMSDKDRGLEASKDEKVGFFERLRMGNIDDEGSEAYRRFGAGRGKAERTPVETMAATPATRPTAAAPEMDAMEAANAREPIPVPAGPRADMRPGGRPSVNVASSAKPAAAKPASANSPAMQEQSYRRTGGASAEDRAQTYTRRGGATAEDRASSPRVAPASNPNYSNEGRGREMTKEQQYARAEAEAKSPEGVAKRKKMEAEQGLERVTPETALLPGGGLKALSAAAKKLATPKAAKLKTYDQAALPAPTKQLGFDKRSAFEKKRAARAAKRRDEMLDENAKNYGLDPKAPGYEAASSAVRKELGGKDFAFKKGGKVKSMAKKMASGGSTSPASKRADGIATRGKTRCKIC